MASKAPDLMAALQKSLAPIRRRREAAGGVPRRVTHWYSHDDFERLPHRTVWRATMECGHVATLTEEEVEELGPLPSSGGLAVLPCLACLEAEREEIVADLPGAD